MARPLLLAVVAIALLLSAPGCGDGSDAPRSREPGVDLRDLDHETLDEATKAQIERFAEVRIPASATGLRSYSRSAMDTQLLTSFRLPREDLDAFVRSGHFQATLVEGNRPIVTSAGEKIGWHLEDAKRVEGLADTSPGLYRNLVVVLDDPQRPAVYLEAATL